MSGFGQGQPAQDHDSLGRYFMTVIYPSGLTRPGKSLHTWSQSRHPFKQMGPSLHYLLRKCPYEVAGTDLLVTH